VRLSLRGDAHVNGAEGCDRRFRRFIEVSKGSLGQYCNAVLAALVSVSALFEDCLRLTKRKLYSS